jgi:hypothetical protein
MVANGDAVIAATGELDGAVRAGIGGEGVDGGPDAVLERAGRPSRPRGAGGCRSHRLPAHLRPWDRLVALLARLKRGEAVLQVLEALHQLRVAIHVEHDNRQTASLGHVEHVISGAERVKLTAETRSQILGGDDTRHATPLYGQSYD